MATKGMQLVETLIADLGITMGLAAKNIAANRFQAQFDAGATIGNATVLALLKNATPEAAPLGIPDIQAIRDTNPEIFEPGPTPDPVTFELATGGVTQVNEGSALEFKVVASRAVEEDTEVTFVLRPGDGTAPDAGTDKTNLNDFGPGAFNPVTVVIAAGETEAVFNVTPLLDGITELTESFSVEATVNGSLLAKQAWVLDGQQGGGKTFVLTTGVDVLTPTAQGASQTTSGNDLFFANWDADAAAGAGRHTLGALDIIDGGLGNDKLIITSDSGVAYTMAKATISNVQEIEIRGDDNVTADVSGSNITGLQTLNSTQTAGNLILTAAKTTDVNTSNTFGDITIKGGNNISIVDGTAGKAILVGSAANKTDDPSGNVSIVDTDNSGANAISVYGGADVNITTTADVEDADPTGNITVGHDTNGTATGNVTVTQNLTSDGSAELDATGVATTITGGKTVTATVNATSAAKKHDSNDDIKIGTITVNADDETSNVKIQQNKNITTFTREAVAGTNATQEVTFKALSKDETVTVNGLTFTANKNLTASEVAQAFSNLTVDDRQDAGGKVANGIYTGQSNTVSGWTSGSAVGASVVFTAPAHNTNTSITTASSAPASAPTKTAIVAGTAPVTKSTSSNDVVYGDVTVNDNAENSIKSITLDGYKVATLGTASADTSLDALETLSLANSSNDATLRTTKTALDVTVNNVMHTVNVDHTAATVTNLKLTSTGAKSAFNLTSVNVENLNLMAGVDLDLSTALFTGNKLSTGHFFIYNDIDFLFCIIKFDAVCFLMFFTFKVRSRN